MTKILFNKAYIPKQALKYVNDAISRQISGDGFYTKKVHEFIEKTFSVRKVLMTTSCSSALDMAGILLDLKDDDEVILPSYTFVSTANPIVMQGAKPVFADILEETLNIDPKDIRRKITAKTKAIFPVHYAGVSCDMDSITQIAREYNLKVVEDAAQGVNAKYRNMYLGTIGDIGCYSFHETKNYSCGEGGAILINTDDQELIERAEIIREKGTNRSKFFRGQVDKYTWVDVGSSFLPSDILAAILIAQFERMDFINSKRRQIYTYYYQSLKFLEIAGLLRLPIIPDQCTSNYHLFYLLLSSELERDSLMFFLKEKGISAIFHYIPLHTSPMGKKMGYKVGDLPVTEDISKRLLRLPLYFGLTSSETQYITSSIYQYFKINFNNSRYLEKING